MTKYAPSESIELKWLLDKSVFLITQKKALYKHFENDYLIVDALTGEPVELNEALVRKIAKASYSGTGTIDNITLISPKESEILKERNVLWQVAFNDEVNTHVFRPSA